MRIVTLSTMDSSGGAARAALRLNSGLQSIGVDSRMVVQCRTSSCNSVYGPTGKLASATAKARLLLDQIPVLPFWRNSKGVFAPGWLPGKAWKSANALHPDIIHLHWITKAFLGVRDLARLNAPLVWTLHDMWAFTGGCHYDMGCSRYRAHCGSCPVLDSKKDNDLSRKVLSRKHKAWQNINLTIVSPSQWLANCARESTLLKNRRIEVIPNGLDLERFKPVDKKTARTHLGLGANSKLILFGAMGSTENERKGFTQLKRALELLSAADLKEKPQVIVFGASQPSHPEYAGLSVQYVGQLDNDQDLVALYAAADVFVAPSLQDNLPNTVMESLACGTPCVAFSIGGMPDMIEHQKNGYLARPYSPHDLADGIAWILGDMDRWQQLSAQSRTSVEQKYELTSVAGKYHDLYKELLGTRQASLAWV